MARLWFALVAIPTCLAYSSYNLTTARNGTAVRVPRIRTSVEDLWLGLDVQNSTSTDILEPVPASDDELISPPGLPPFTSSYKLPANFVWGWGTSAPQIEGSVKADGRGPSIWDTVTHRVPGFIARDQSLDITTDHYYRYKEDALRMKQFGVPAYSLTISWSRILPFGNGTVSQAGLQHYIDEVNYLTDNGITPVVTLYHWDLPQALQDAYGGWLNRKIIKDFGSYARIVFNALAPKVKIWITMNEPQVFCQDYADWPENGVPDDVFPVFGVSDPVQRKYMCGHHALLAHGRAVDIFRKEIVTRWGPGKISFANSWDYTPAYSSDPDDILASQRSLDFTAGWFGKPIYIDGEYPQSLRDTFGSAIPPLNKHEKGLILGSSDFYAWDGYTGHPVKAAEEGFANCTSNTDSDSWPECFEEVYTLPGGWMIGSKADTGVSSWLYQTPLYFRQGIQWSWNYFKPKEYFIPEFGFSVWKESDMSLDRARYDDARTAYLKDYLNEVLNIVNEDKINLTGVIAWSAFDNFEWRQGADTRFGLQYVDYTTMKRYFKKSAFFMREFFRYYTQP